MGEEIFRPILGFEVLAWPSNVPLVPLIFEDAILCSSDALMLPNLLNMREDCFFLCESLLPEIFPYLYSS